MGRVWLAVDDLLNREVAVKEIVLRAEHSEADRIHLHVRTIGEACAAARVCHANVVQVHDVIRTPDGTWIVMEYIRGSSLRQIIIDRGPLPPREVASVGLAMLAALGAAHRKGVLHRDVKPGNVLVASDGRVVLTDFGVATIGNVEVDDDTRAGIVEGVPDYLAPERVLDGRSSMEGDLWSLGATLYTAVEGRPPFSRICTVDTLAAVTTEPPDPSCLAGPLAPVLEGLLHRDPRARMDSAEAERLLREVVRLSSNVSPQEPRDAPANAADGTAQSVTAASPGEPGTAAGTEPPTGPADAAAPHGTRPRRRRSVVLTGTVTAAFVAVAAAVVLANGEVLSGAHSGARFVSSGNAPLAITSRQAAPAAEPSGSVAGVDRFLLPPGWTWYEDPTGFRLAVPVGWTVSRDNLGVYFQEPTGYRMLAVRQWKPSNAEPVSAWIQQEEADVHRLTNYQRIRIENVPQYFSSCADWEYRYDVDGTRLHTLERGFTTTEGRSLAFSWRASEFDWSINEANFLLVAASLRVG